MKLTIKFFIYIVLVLINIEFFSTKECRVKFYDNDYIFKDDLLEQCSYDCDKNQRICNQEKFKLNFDLSNDIKLFELLDHDCVCKVTTWKDEDTIIKTYTLDSSLLKFDKSSNHYEGFKEDTVDANMNLISFKCHKPNLEDMCMLSLKETPIKTNKLKRDEFTDEQQIAYNKGVLAAKQIAKQDKEADKIITRKQVLRTPDSDNVKPKIERSKVFNELYKKEKLGPDDILENVINKLKGQEDDEFNREIHIGEKNCDKPKELNGNQLLDKLTGSFNNSVSVKEIERNKIKEKNSKIPTTTNKNLIRPLHPTETKSLAKEKKDQSQDITIVDLHEPDNSKPKEFKRSKAFNNLYQKEKLNSNEDILKYTMDKLNGLDHAFKGEIDIGEKNCGDKPKELNRDKLLDKLTESLNNSVLENKKEQKKITKPVESIDNAILKDFEDKEKILDLPLDYVTEKLKFEDILPIETVEENPIKDIPADFEKENGKDDKDTDTPISDPNLAHLIESKEKNNFDSLYQKENTNKKNLTFGDIINTLDLPSAQPRGTPTCCDKKKKKRDNTIETPAPNNFTTEHLATIVKIGNTGAKNSINNNSTNLNNLKVKKYKKYSKKKKITRETEEETNNQPINPEDSILDSAQNTIKTREETTIDVKPVAEIKPVNLQPKPVAEINPVNLQPKPVKAEVSPLVNNLKVIAPKTNVVKKRKESKKLSQDQVVNYLNSTDSNTNLARDNGVNGNISFRNYNNLARETTQLVPNPTRTKTNITDKTKKFKVDDVIDENNKTINSINNKIKALINEKSKGVEKKKLKKEENTDHHTSTNKPLTNTPNKPVPIIKTQTQTVIKDAAKEKNIVRKFRNEEEVEVKFEGKPNVKENIGEVTDDADEKMTMMNKA
jgi:hypothetical protein